MLSCISSPSCFLLIFPEVMCMQSVSQLHILTLTSRKSSRLEVFFKLSLSMGDFSLSKLTANSQGLTVKAMS